MIKYVNSLLILLSIVSLTLDRIRRENIEKTSMKSSLIASLSETDLRLRQQH